MSRFVQFVSDDAGAVTVDWVAVTAGVLLVAILAVFSIFNNGVALVVAGINSDLGEVTSDLDLAGQQ